MRTNLIVGALVVFATVAGTGCLKDKGFEDRKYGTEIVESKAVSFPEATSSPIAADIVSKTESQTINGPLLVLEQDGVASSDVQVKITMNNALLGPLGLTPLPVSSYTINSLNAIIPAGKKNVQIQIVIPNASVLDPSVGYGIGLTIAEVSSGYKIASNLKTVVVSFSIRNKYDGIYKIRGYHVRGGDPVLTGLTGAFERSLITSGVSSARWEGTVPWAAQASSLPAGYEPNIMVNESNNKVTVTSSNGLVSQDNAYNNRWDPATKTFYIKWVYAAAAERSFTDTLVYNRVR